MKIRSVTTLLIVMGYALTACTSYQVVTFTNDASKFTSYFTYELEHLKSKVNDQEVKKPDEVLRLEKILHQQMSDRKYQQSTTYADLTLRYELISNQRTTYDVDAFSYRRSFYDPYGYWYNINERNFTESILLLELKDAATAKIVWQGSLDLRYTRRAKNVDDLIEDAVSRIFESYHYEAGSDQPIKQDEIN